MDKKERVSVSYAESKSVAVCHGQEISVLTEGEEKCQ